MKWLLALVAGLLLALAPLHADPAADLYNQGLAALNNNDYKTAAQDFDQVLTNYPSTPIIHDVRIEDGFANLSLGNYPKVIDVLSKETVAGGPSQGSALFYTGEAQLEQANKQTTAYARNAGFAQAVATFTRLISTITSAPTGENRDYLEEALYNRSLAYQRMDQLPQAEADVQRILQQFDTSPSRPDYRLLLGTLYAQQASEVLNTKKGTESTDDVRALAAKASDALDQAIADPNALVQANEARLAKAQVAVLVAGLDLPNTDGYQKAIDAYHDVRRKADLIPVQEQRILDLKALNQSRLQNMAAGNASAAANNGLTRLIERENGRLDDLKNGPDPIIQALIGIAQCYDSMKEGDEARTVIHRLAHTTLTEDEQRAVDLALIYSYVLGGETEKADKTLTDYLAKHPGDPQAQGVSVQIGGELMKRKDYQGALAQANRSLHDFPTGPYAGQAIELKAEALTSLGQLDAAKSVEDDYLRQNPGSAVALGLLLSRAQDETAENDLNAALADYGKVKDAASASPEVKSAGAAGYIQTLQTLDRNDDVIRESQAFATSFPASPLLPNVLVMQAVAMDKKHDPGAVAALQDVARKFPPTPDNSAAPFALYYILTIYQRAGNVPAMLQAATDLEKAYPDRYPLLLQAAEAVSAAEVKQKKYDLAIAQYQPLATASDAGVAATAQTRIGDIWLKAAKGLGPYQSMQQQTERDEAQKRLGSAEQAFLGVLKNSPDQIHAVDDAFHGLEQVLLQRRSWGLLKDADFEGYLAKITAGLTDPAMQTRIELAKAGLVFIEKDGSKQYPAALARFRAAVNANPALPLTRTEANRYGELLLAAKDYDTARQVYTNLLATDPKDPYTQADGDYGMGASYLAQDNIADAKQWFEKMKALPGGAAWNDHILDADFGLALAAEQSGQASDLAAAKQTYTQIMQSPTAGVDLQAKAMLGYGRLLAKEGHTTTPVVAGTMESAVAYYKQVDTIFGPAAPELSAQGLFMAGQLYDQAGDKADAQKMYQSILTNYKTTAPDWAAKAQAASQT